MNRVAWVGLLAGFFAFGAACGKPAACPTPESVAVPERSAQAPAVVLDSCDGTKGQCGRAEQIRKEIQDVVGSAELECLVTRFDQESPIGRAGTENAIDECGVAAPPIGRHGLIGYRDSRCVEAQDVGSSMPMARTTDATTNDGIYRIFRASPADCDGRALGTIHLAVDISSTPRPMGRTEPSPTGETLTNDFWFDQAKNYEVAGHWIHEHTHRLGFCDRGAEQYSPILVPYVYGFAGCLVAARQEESKTKPLSAYRAVCQEMLGPAFKP